ALQTDGKLVAVGYTTSVWGSQDFALARYNADGTLDTTFGTGGKVTTDFSGGNDLAYGVALQTDGKIVAAGDTTSGGGGKNIALARYNANGSPDTTFGSGGKVTTDVSGTDDVANDVVLQSDGKIVVAGYTITGGGKERFAVVRYTVSGSLDTSFNGTGIAV